MALDKVRDQPPARIRSDSRGLDRISRDMRMSVRASVFLEDIYKLGYIRNSASDEEEEEKPQVHKGWLLMNPIAERKSK